MAKSVFDGVIDQGMGVCNRVFGFEVIYYFKDNPSVGFPVQGIFEAAGLVLDTSGEVPVETRKPVLGIRKTDFVKAGYRLPKKGDTVDVNGELYEVTKAPSTDDGWSEARLVLMKKGGGSYA